MENGRDGHPAPTIGERLRAIRHARRLRLRDVADRAGLSESFLSQVERSRTNASVSSLQRIAAALGIEVSDVFAAGGAARANVLRAAERQTVSFGTLARKSLLTPKPFHSVEVVLAEFDPGGSTGPEPYSHGDSEEVFVVLAGRVDLQLGDEMSRLESGDAAHYRSSTPHRMQNSGPERAEVMYIISPPSY